MQTVYRVENFDGHGPYRGEYASWGWMEVSHDKREDTPGIFTDCLDDIYDDLTDAYGREQVLFGFLSLDKLRRWFTKYERKELCKRGYYIKKFKVDIVIEGRTESQCIFIKQ